jgi:hypothetical protein
MKRYLQEVTPTERPFTHQGEKQRSVPLIAHFGKDALAGITSELVAVWPTDPDRSALPASTQQGKLRA